MESDLETLLEIPLGPLTSHTVQSTLSTLQQKRDRPIVDQLDLHHRAEDARRNLQARSAEGVGK